MKKGLSVLLIAAALFGFYGGAVNIQDVLAAKDYWEKKSEQTTADLNKLEDGLKTLDENKETYLEGLDKIADAEKQLADGEADLAEGEANYEAAPGKLADAREQIAQGESDLEEGVGKLKKLKTAITGAGQIVNGYKNNWRPGFEALKDGRKQLFDGAKGSKDSLTALAAFLDSGQKAYLAAVEDVAADDGRQTANDYKEFIKSTNELADDIPKIQKSVKEKAEGANALLNALKAAKTNYEFAGIVSAKRNELNALAAFITNPTDNTRFTSGVKSVADAYDNFDALVDQTCNAPYEDTGKTNLEMAELQAWGIFFESSDGQAAIAGAKQAIALAIWQKQSGKTGQPETDAEIADYKAILTGVNQEQAKELIQKSDKEPFKSIQSQVKAAAKDGIREKVLAGFNENPDLTNGKAGLIDAMTKIAAGLDEVNEQVNGDGSALKNKLLPGLKQFNAAATSKKIDELSKGQDDIAGGIATIGSGVLNNKELKAGVRKEMGNKAITLLRRYSGKSSPAYTKNANFEKFENQMDSNPGLVSLLKKARKFLGKTRASGLKTYNSGVKKLKAGKAQYAQGLKDYEAAPAKLEDGRQKLADGRKELAAGKEKLAEYEDGEQQVRDGLATLMSSDRYGDLDTILERRNGDDNFDAEDKSLDIPEGLEAVGTGREYQKDTGEIVTAELGGRILGSGLELGAAAIAVLAALLSLLKKLKGAAVSAVAAAAAGVGGMIATNNAGMEMSQIAGSTIGATPMIAAGILAAVAAVFSIVHFTAKKEV